MAHHVTSAVHPQHRRSPPASDAQSHPTSRNATAPVLPRPTPHYLQSNRTNTLDNAGLGRSASPYYTYTSAMPTEYGADEPATETNLGERFRNLSVMSQPLPLQSQLYHRRGPQAIHAPYLQSAVPHEMVDNGPDTTGSHANFRLRRRDFFSVGRVFLVRWDEPAGETEGVSGYNTDFSIAIGPYQERVHSKIRCFVVVRQADTYCSAIPITTYRSQGVSKPGVSKDHHAIIFTGQEPPASLPSEAPSRGESGMREPIRVVPDNPIVQLDSASRLDFGRVHTVQHNIKVKPFGTIHLHYMDTLLKQVSDVWLNDGVSSTRTWPSESGRPWIRGNNIRDADIPQTITKYLSPSPLHTTESTFPLDPTFKVRLNPAKFFRLGKVFINLFSESTNSPLRSGSGITVSMHGENVHSVISRFVVIRENKGSCAALRILTYGGRGCCKPGVQKADHARIYTGLQPPEILDDERPRRGELPMQSAAFRVTPHVLGEGLDSHSRINLGKVYTIEHNVKVRGFGMVDDFQALYHLHKAIWDGTPLSPPAGGSSMPESREQPPLLGSGNGSRARPSPNQNASNVFLYTSGRETLPSYTRDSANYGLSDYSHSKTPMSGQQSQQAYGQQPQYIQQKYQDQQWLSPQQYQTQYSLQWQRHQQQRQDNQDDDKDDEDDEDDEDGED